MALDTLGVNGRRDKITIMSDLLNIIQEPRRVTHILYKSNMSYVQLLKYLDNLMQMLYLLGLGIVGLSLMGTGMLANTGGNIDLWVQAIGWGEGDLESPVDNAKVEILLDTIPPENEGDDPITFVSACGFSSTEDIPLGQGKSDGLIICKLLNEDGNAIAEGSIPLTVSAVNPNVAYDKSETLIIDINQPISLDATHIDQFFDAMIIVEAPL